MSTTDAKVLTLQKKVEQQKEELKGAKKFTPITNCSLELYGLRYNLHVLTTETAITLLVRLNALKMSADSLGLTDSCVFAGYKLTDWIVDVQAKLDNLGVAAKKSQLAALESKLAKLLSEEKRNEIELQEIEKLLD